MRAVGSNPADPAVLGGLRAISGQLGKRSRLISDHKVNGGGTVHPHAGFFSN